MIARRSTRPTTSARASTRVLLALTAAALGGCQLVSGLSEISVASTTGTSSSGGGGGAPPTLYPCSPDPATCPESSSPCLALAGPADDGSITLRVAQLDLVKPSGLYIKGTKNFLFSGVTLDLPRCKLPGLGTFSWLLRFGDGTLRTGAAKPVADPTLGFSFAEDLIPGTSGPIATGPIDLPLTVVGASGSFVAKGGPEVIVPLYLDPDATQAIALPIHALQISGTLSSDRRCVGAYTPASVETENGCLGDKSHHAYVNGGTIEGYVPLEEADTVIAGAFGQSLCLLLTGDPDTYGDGGSPIARCKRDAAGQIEYRGDWCSLNNNDAKPDCYDALRLDTSFAASAVKLLP